MVEYGFDTRCAAAGKVLGSGRESVAGAPASHASTDCSLPEGGSVTGVEFYYPPSQQLLDSAKEWT